MAGSASLEHEESKSETVGSIKTGQTKNTVYDGTNTTNTAGSTNTTVNTGSTNNTTNSGSTNTSINGASTNTTVNSGSTNTSNTNASQNSIRTDASKNTTVIGPSSSSTSSVTKTSDQINTSQLLLTKEATDYMVQGILEGTNGLASVASGQKASGAYNSSTNTLLVNDLLARTAGEVAARSAITKNVIGGTTSTTDSLTMNSGSTTTQNIGASNTTQNIGATSASQIIGGSTSTQNIGGSTNTQLIGGSSSSTSVGGNTTTQNIGATSTTQGAKGTSAEDILTNTDSKTNTESQTTKAAVKVGWILCTELWLQGRMPTKHYVHGSKVFASYGPAAKRGYYIWAVPALAHLRKYPFSRRSKLMCSLLNARAEYIAAEAGLRTARKTVLGFVAKNLYWGCVLLGHTVARDVPEIYEEVTSNG